jgi:hypothetical protein
VNRCSKGRVLDRVFAQLQHAQIARLKIETVTLNSTTVDVDQDGTGVQKNGPQAMASPAPDGH